MKFSILASGSKGNSTYIEADGRKILIDVGITFKDLSSRLESVGINIGDIDTLLITHSHSDHVKGLSTFYNKVKPTIYMADKTYEELDLLDIDYVSLKEDFNIGNINIHVITLSHDVACYGYIITYNGESIVYITDTGYINERYFGVLKNKNIYIFESNHDVEMNLKSKKPFRLRQRVVSDFGHLSNNQAAYYLSKIVGSDTKKIFLAHISEDDNREELALETTRKAISKIDISCAKQREVLPMVEV